MKRAAVCFTLLAAAALQGRTAPGPSGIEALLADLAGYEFGQSREPLERISGLLRESLEDPARLKQIEAHMARFLESDATAAAKDFVFRELSVIATPASAPALARLLEREDTGGMALYALARIPGTAVDQALRKRLPKAEGSARIGIIRALGQRRDPKSVGPLAALLSSSAQGVAEAAASALAHIGSRPALDALTRARRRAPAPLRELLAEACLACADRLAPGDSGRAVKVYRELLAEQLPAMLHARALSGLAAVDPAGTVPLLARALESKDARLEGAAAGFLAGIPGPGAARALAAALETAPPAGQVRLLGALAERGDSSAAPAVVRALNSDAPEVRAAALTALGRLGGAAHVKILAEAAAAGEGAVQAAARQSLRALRDPAADAAIAAAIPAADGKVKAELVMAAGERGASETAAVLVEALADPHLEVRREALRGLRNVAGPAQVPALIDLLTKAAGASQRRDAAQTLAAVLRRLEPPPMDGLLAAYQAAPKPVRLSLIEVMGQTSSSQALPLLREGLKGDPETARAAILALSEWSDPAPLPDLASLAAGAPSPALQTLALRGYLKLLALPSRRSAQESAAMLREALRLAKQAAEKRTVLSLLPLYPARESLETAETLLNDPALAAEARAAAERIRNSLNPR
ncbi:MAG: HEAT repeat domain-containing protein [Bryobacterales bacterium]|nr:HEAT repeat domain-containing protein [Bryobacterales bacterium]